MSDFLGEISGKSEIEQIHAVQSHLLSPLNNDGHLLGTYNEFWLISMYHLGYGHPETQELAYKWVNLTLEFLTFKELSDCTGSLQSSTVPRRD